MVKVVTIERKVIWGRTESIRTSWRPNNQPFSQEIVSWWADEKRQLKECFIKGFIDVRKYNFIECLEMDWRSQIRRWFRVTTLSSRNGFSIIYNDRLISKTEAQIINLKSTWKKKEEIIIRIEITVKKPSPLWKVDGWSQKNCIGTSNEKTVIAWQDPKEKRRVV